VTLPELLDRWRIRRGEWRRLGVSVDGAKLCEEILADLEQLDAVGEQALSLVEAASECGYSADHLGRLVRSGQIPNAGRANAPKVRRRDLPKKTRCPSGSRGVCAHSSRPPADRGRLS